MKRFFNRNRGQQDEYAEDDFEVMDLDEEYDEEEQYFGIEETEEYYEAEEPEDDIEYYESEEAGDDIEYCESGETEDDIEYYRVEESEDDIEYYESEETEDDIEYYESKETEDDIEYYESEEQEDDIEYYELEESEEEIEYYESENGEIAEYYESELPEEEEYYEVEDEEYYEAESEEYDEEYYEMDEYGDENEYYYEEDGRNGYGNGNVISRIISFLSNMSGMDRLIAATGALVLVFALVAGSMFVSAKVGESQVAAFAELGTELDDVEIIGESGLIALADSKLAKQEAAALAEAEEETEEVAVGEIDVVMNLSSIQQDLKIKFINKKSSKLIASVPFEVEITDADKKTYTLIDEDMDGIIYQKGIVPGEYKVTMQKLEEKYAEYNISTDTQKVTVKDKIEYKKVDVEDEIKSEAEVNAAVEDTKVQEQVESSNTDTVAFVESTKTEIGEGYKEINKATITDPSTTARLQTGDFRKLSNIATNTVIIKKGESTAVTTSLTGDFITWLSADENIAVIDGNQTGKTNTISAKTVGTAVVTASNGTDTETFQVTVTEGQITLDKQTASVQVGQTVTIHASATAKWTSSDTSVATVDGNGVVTGVKAGTAAITAEADGTTSTCIVTVFESSTTISTSAMSIKVGETATLKATVTGADKSVAWTSSDTSVATVELNGTVTGKKVGTATITATANGVSAKCTVTVTGDQPSVSTDTSTALKDSNGNQVYIQNEAGEYVAAVYADYYKYDKFYIKQPAYKYTGWQTIDGSVYYYDADGNVVKGTQVIQGATYNFDSVTGALVTTSGVLGIDVSKWNGDIDWNAVKNSGVNYVIIRCGYRGSSTGALIEDPKFKANIKGATSSGLKVGVYFFSQATSEVEAVEEASMVLSLIKGYNISYPVFLDVEPSGGRGDSISKEVRTSVINAFCQTISNSGYASGVYANKTWLESKFSTGNLSSSCKIWLAQYAAQPTYGGKYNMWQYTSKGKVNGISGDVDMNLSYLGY